MPFTKSIRKIKNSTRKVNDYAEFDNYKLKIKFIKSLQQSIRNPTALVPIAVSVLETKTHKINLLSLVV